MEISKVTQVLEMANFLSILMPLAKASHMPEPKARTYILVMMRLGKDMNVEGG
jgi:hypothetical protein